MKGSPPFEKNATVSCPYIVLHVKNPDQQWFPMFVFPVSGKTLIHRPICTKASSHGSQSEMSSCCECDTIYISLSVRQRVKDFSDPRCPCAHRHYVRLPIPANSLDLKNKIAAIHTVTEAVEAVRPDLLRSGRESQP